MGSPIIIIDYSAIAIATVFSQPGDLDENRLRHQILNSIRMYNSKFRKEYGQTIIACDQTSWRKETFPQYKAKRKSARTESPLDWGKVFGLLNGIRDEISSEMPYPVITVDRAEADDVIAALVESTQEFGMNEKVMIVSADKDFLQLHRYSNVKQFSPMKKNLITVDDPLYYKFEHICKGDVSDGVPNVLSPDNTFTDGIRQTPMRVKKIKEWFDQPSDKLIDAMGTEAYRNYCRNKSVIDFDCIPTDIVENIMGTYKSQQGKTNAKILNYLITKRCSMLVESANDFFTN